jgi:hypothetical protein
MVGERTFKCLITGPRACYTALRYRMGWFDTMGMGSLRRSFVFALLCIWIATTGSTCQSTVTGSHFQARGEGAAVILVVLVAAGVACLASENGCQAREPTPFDQVQTTFESGVDLIEEGDSAGLDRICLAGHQGYAKAQYYYGVHLFRHDPTNSVESLAWLKRAAAQDHKAARHMLVQMTDWTSGARGVPALRPLAVAPPALRACVTRPAAAPPVPVLEAMGPQPDVRS